ncbi:DUF86 domain-containing protein [Adlercreutzia sp. ZJ138]|uniref:HepT-like ribonuclease domain-containing protein n=1 Tax=Adlercreutzia sp. ZJ138 TaxID=2709405 RepID=UPI0013EBB928|nr:HepT-like ribonuclease domain-containing protein [Adlercreutzia sp. ZJ138]
MDDRSDISPFLVQEVLINARMIDSRIKSERIDEELFSKSPFHQDLLTMPLLRICELVSNHKDAFKAINPSYPWDEVAKMRSKIAHPYGGFDFYFVWTAIVEDLPSLVSICEDYVS